MANIMEQELKSLRQKLREAQEANDALTAERDALKAERDALIVERDAEKARSLFKKKLRGLIKHRKTRKLKRFIRNNSEQILNECDKSNLLGMSLKYDNFWLYEFLFDNKLNVDFEVELPDMTSLIAALEKDDQEEANRLYWMHSDAIIRQLHGGKVFKFSDSGLISIKQTDWSRNILIPYIIFKISRELSWSYGRIGTTLGQFEFNLLDALVSLGNAELTEAYLTWSQPNLDDKYWYFEFICKILVKHHDLRQIQVILNYVPDSRYFRARLIERVMKKICNLHRTEAGRTFVKELFSFELLMNRVSLNVIEGHLMSFDNKRISTFLEYDFIKYKDRDLLACMLGNSKADVMSLLKNRKINVNSRGRYRQTPLHFAVAKKCTKYIQILLDNGADPNALDEDGSTPLNEAFRHKYNGNYSIEEECVKLLLVNGANPLLMNRNSYETISSFAAGKNGSSEYTNITKLLAAQLAVYETSGQSVEERIGVLRKWPIKNFDTFYENCRSQLEQLKTHNVRTNNEFSRQNFSMFELLSERIDRNALYIDEDDRRVIMDFMNQYEEEKSLIDFYKDTLKRRLEVINRITPIIEAIECVFLKYMGFYDVNHLVVHKIMKHLTFRDLYLNDNSILYHRMNDG